MTMNELLCSNGSTTRERERGALVRWAPEDSAAARSFHHVNVYPGASCSEGLLITKAPTKPLGKQSLMAPL